ncbi:MAG: TniQ family protein [Mycobacteriales bacterium]
MKSAAVGWLRWRPRPLPRRVSPVQDETISSYLRRLAAANHIRADELVDFLLPRPRSPLAASRDLEVSLPALATVSTINPVHLAHALPEIRPQLTDQSSLRIAGRTTVKSPNRTQPACRRCMAAKNITTTVAIWARPDQNVCLRHQLWIGRGADRPEDQADIADLPEIGNAQIRHRNLIRRHGLRRVRYFYLPAQEIIDWSTNFPADTPRWQRRKYLFTRENARSLPWSYDFAAYYPEVVALLSVLASPYWRRVAISDDLADKQRFYRQTSTSLAGGIPEQNRPLNKWVESQRNHRTPEDPDGEQALHRWHFGPSGAVEPLRPESTQQRDLAQLE